MLYHNFGVFDTGEYDNITIASRGIRLIVCRPHVQASASLQPPQLTGTFLGQSPGFSQNHVCRRIDATSYIQKLQKYPNPMF